MHTIDIAPFGSPPEIVTAEADFIIDGRPVCVGCIGRVLKRDPVRSNHQAVQVLTPDLIGSLLFDTGIQQTAMSPEDGERIVKALFDIEVLRHVQGEPFVECTEPPVTEPE